MARMITAQRLDANDPANPWAELNFEEREEVADWLLEHGLEPRNTTAVERDTIDCALIRVTVYDIDANGALPLNDTGDGPATRTIEIPQRTDPPAWWQWP
jgi:hypothetical protein